MSSDKLKTIFAYANMGWRVLPVHFKLKQNDGTFICSCKNVDCNAPLKHPVISSWDRKATTNTTLLEAQWKREPRLNVGILMGKDSGKDGLVALDVDGPEGLKTFKNLSKDDPPTVMSQTGSGKGLHVLYKYDKNLAKELGGKISNRVKFLPGLDLRGDSGFIIVSPSEHISGNKYKWLNSPQDFELQEMPKWLKEALLASKTALQTIDIKDIELIGEIPFGERNDRLFLLAATTHNKTGFDKDVLVPYIQAVNKKFCNPPLEDKEIETICKSACGYNADDQVINGIKLYEPNDGGNGERLRDMFFEVLRYDHNVGKWFIWNGQKWELDEKQQVIKFAEDAAQKIKDQIDLYDDNKKKSAFRKWYNHSQNNNGLRAALDNASSKSPIASISDEFDKELTLFNFKNGCIHTKTFEIFKHIDVKNKMITKISPVVYDPKAKCELWLKFLNEIFCNDQELIKYVQKAVGYTLTGEMREQGFFFLHGDGSNGKTTFLNILMKIFGDYSKKADINTFMRKPSENISNTNDLAELKGIRLITSSEPEEGTRFALSRLKQWTGSEPIKARFLFKEFFQFLPIGQIWIAGNEKPKIKEKNFGAWRRVKLIPFEIQIPEDKQDLELEQKLTLELSGIFNWVLDGLKLYRAEGLQVPEKVRLAVEAYRAEMDSIMSFVQMNVEFVDGESISNMDLYENYKDFCNVEGFKPLGMSKFTQTIDKDNRFKKEKIGNRIHWKGIKVNKEFDEVIEELW